MKTKRRDGGVTQMIENLHNNRKALSSNSRTTKNKLIPQSVAVCQFAYGFDIKQTSGFVFQILPPPRLYSHFIGVEEEGQLEYWDSFLSWNLEDTGHATDT
jgi:hypothetical protein